MLIVTGCSHFDSFQLNCPDDVDPGPEDDLCLTGQKPQGPSRRGVEATSVCHLSSCCNQLQLSKSMPHEHLYPSKMDAGLHCCCTLLQSRGQSWGAYGGAAVCTWDFKDALGTIWVRNVQRVGCIIDDNRAVGGGKLDQLLQLLPSCRSACRVVW